MNKNQGIGGYDEPERAFMYENYTNTFRAQEVGPLGRRFFINTRLNVGWSDSERDSSVEAPTVRILDAQTFGGAQKAGRRHSRDVNFASDLTMSAASIPCGWERRSTSTGTGPTNPTTTSALTRSRTLEAFDAGRPRSYTRRIGVPERRLFQCAERASMCRTTFAFGGACR